MSDLSFVAGEFPKLAATSRETADAVRAARPEGGASAFASAMPGANLASPMQAAEEKLADQCMKTSARLEECADSLEAAERDFIAAEEENGQLIGSIVNGDDCGHSGPGGGRGDRKNPRLVPLPSPIDGGNPPQRGPRLPGDPGKQRGGHHPGEGTRGHRRPTPGTGRPKVEPTPFNPRRSAQALGSDHHRTDRSPPPSDSWHRASQGASREAAQDGKSEPGSGSDPGIQSL